MNKINIYGVLIVEGVNDVSYLSSFINALFFITNGYDLNEDKIDFLQRVSKVNRLIILTDPDEAGNRIKEVIKSRINPVFEANIEKIYRKKTKKFGVAELTKEAVINAIKPYASDKEVKQIDYDLPHLLSLNNNVRESRNRVIRKYRLMNGNNKSIENQLRMLNISPDELRRFVNGNQ